MFATLARRMAQAPKPKMTPNVMDVPTPYTYKLKKVWPPDFSKLSPQEQLRFEKRFKRRLHHISARPKWNKFIKLAQLSSVTCMAPLIAVVFPVSQLTKSSLASRRRLLRAVHGLEE